MYSVNVIHAHMHPLPPLKKKHPNDYLRKKNVMINWPQGTPESPVQATPDMIT